MSLEKCTIRAEISEMANICIVGCITYHIVEHHIFYIFSYMYDTYMFWLPFVIASVSATVAISKSVVSTCDVQNASESGYAETKLRSHIR